MTIVRFLLVATLLAVGAASASAALYNLSGTMDGAQANSGAGTGSPGTGTILGTYNDVTMFLTWEVSWSGLEGTATLAHFHGPALPGVSAGVQVGIGVESNPAIGSTTITADQGSDLLAGLWYVNIHSDVDPGGEIRGQVGTSLIPEPAVTCLALFAGVFALRRRRP